ncbi:MAG TPA: bacteriohopanetetrol glucosamine biosynthesis glycosyltransferase HpnI [Terriglobales bacterium]|nr:bacteriohopanetetrol glucosamine biosynthesis glycosyltransferase HpnI [Terriglobales bacterium]
MIHHSIQLIELLATLGTLSGVGYYSICLAGAVRFLQDRKIAYSSGRSSFLPPISILKPLKGTDPEMYESFRSHCLLDYPEYEIIFGVSEANDPAADLVRRLQSEFPQCAIQLVVCGRNLGTNRKVSNLAQMLPSARFDHLIVNDGDIRVQPDYLQRVIAPLADPQVGMVTCLYRGVPNNTLGSRLESIGISTDFSGGVLSAREVEKGIHFALGSTMAFRRSDLNAIGGFEAVVDYLADDYELGRRTSARGLKVTLSEVIVETFLPPYKFRQFFDHQLRWSRSLRDARRWGYIGVILTFGVPWALVVLASIRGTYWAWGLAVLAVIMRMAVAVVVGRGVLKDRRVLPWLWLVPIRDLVAVAVWIASFAGHTVEWRGTSFTLKDGKLAKVAAD